MRKQYVTTQAVGMNIVSSIDALRLENAPNVQVNRGKDVEEHENGLFSQENTGHRGISKNNSSNVIFYRLAKC